MYFPSWVVCALGVILATVLEVGHSLPQSNSHWEGDNHDEVDRDKPKLLYILMDGFRWDYIDKQNPDALPGFSHFLKDGVRARWTIPIFPSVSYPSWTTLVTGLYAENHNIIGNFFYDPFDKDEFSLSNTVSTKKQKWWTSEPIWTTAEKAGLKTAQFQWSRCDVPIDNLVTHHCEPYLNYASSFLKNIMKALGKFDDGYDFVQVYTEEPDVIGHRRGPESAEVRATVRDLDSVIVILLDELQKRNLFNKVNIVIVSDHGMHDTAVGSTQCHEVDEYLDISLVEKISGQGGHMKITVPQEYIQQVYDQLSQIPGASVFKKENIPESFHFKNAKYIPDILVAAHDGHLVKRSCQTQSKGSHGLSTALPDMRGIFFAKGPEFRKGVVIEPIHLVDVYQVLIKVLEIIPQPNNGTWSHVEPAFKSSLKKLEPPNGSSASMVSSVVLVFFFITFIGCLVVVILG